MQRTLDIIIAAGGLIFLSPLMLLLALITEALTPGAFVRHNNRLKFRPVHSVVSRLSLDELPVLIDILLGHQSFFDQETPALFRPAETRTDTEFDRELFGYYLLAWLLIGLVLYVLYLSVR